MGANSKIEWTNDTWNPWQGCHKVSVGCKFCYMYRDKKRYGQDPRTVVRSAIPTFNAPLTKLNGPLVFTCSWSDFFIEEADNWRDEAWDIIKRTPHLTYQILTKRPADIKDRLPDDWEKGYRNVWLGVSVENKNSLWRLEALDEIPAAIKFISYEPALEYVDFTTYTPVINWIISGGESGPEARPAEIEWFKQVRDDCLKNGIAYFHKQHGGTKKIDGVWGGRLLDGMEWNGFPVSSTIPEPDR